MKPKTIMNITIVVYILVCVGLPFLFKYCIFESQQMSNLTNNEWAGFLGSYVGGILGGLGTLISVVYTVSSSFDLQNKGKDDEEKREEQFAAAILYNDLRSIERYVRDATNHINIRFSNDWQSMIAKCLFLEDYQIEWLYELYDEIYNYNYSYALKEQDSTRFDKEDISQYSEIKQKLFRNQEGVLYAEDYEEVMALLISKKQGKLHGKKKKDREVELSAV